MSANSKSSNHEIKLIVGFLLVPLALLAFSFATCSDTLFDILKWNNKTVLKYATCLCLLIATIIFLKKSKTKQFNIFGANIKTIIICLIFVSTPASLVIGNLYFGLSLRDEWRETFGTEHHVLLNNASSDYKLDISDANSGYMTREDDEQFTAIAIEKGHGESITKDQQDFLDAAEKGKFGKPYGDRPDQDHDSPDPLK